MAVQIDKEVLIKHHFWILTGCFLVIVLVPLLLLGTGISSTVTKEEADLASAKKLVKDISNPKNQKIVDAYTTKDKYVRSKRDVVWKEAWETQKDLMTWPTHPEIRFGDKYKYFGEPIMEFDALEFGNVYNDQVAPVVWLVQPLISPNEGAVQFKGGNPFSLLELNRRFDNNPPPSREDVWLAQEDLWVKRELLRVVRDANDAVAVFKEVKPPEPPAPAVKEAKPEPAAEPAKTDGKADASAEKAKPAAKPAAPPAPKGDPFHKVFRNPSWEIDLTLARNAKNKFVLRGKIKNISKRKLSPAVEFNVFLDDQGSRPALLSCTDKPPLAAGESAVIDDQPVNETLTVKQLFGVEQILTWRTAPVKRIDTLLTNYPSSRTSYRTLKKPRWLAEAAAADAAAPAAGGEAAGTPGRLGGGMMGGGGMGMGLGAGGEEQSKNGLRLSRYTDTNDQVRHMPVSMVVIVEEDHIPEFLGAYANSRLRIQTLQAHWRHVKERIKPESADGTPTGGVAAGGVAGGGKREPAGGGEGTPRLGGGGLANKGGGMGGSMAGMMSSMMGGGQNMPGMVGNRGGYMSSGQRGIGAGQMGGMTGPGFRSGGEDEEEAEMNLVELAVYGLASLYERYPAKAPGADQSAGTTK